MSKPRNNPVSGAAYFVRGFGLITRKGVKRYVVAPLLINTLLFGGAIWWGASRLPALRDWVEAQLTGWLPDWSWLQSTVEWISVLLIPLFVLVAVLVVFFGFAVLANLIAAPFNGLLAEAVETQIAGRSMEEGGWKRLLADVFKALYSELRKLLYFLLRALPLLVISVIPGLNLAAPVLWFLFGAWMLAVEYADYPMGNHGMTFPQQRRRLKSRRMLSLGFGGLATAALMVPGLNFLVIPAAVAGATAMWVEQLADAPDARRKTD